MMQRGVYVDGQYHTWVLSRPLVAFDMLYYSGEGDRTLFSGNWRVYGIVLAVL